MSRSARFAWLVPALLSALGGACAEPAGAARIVGPDGTQMLHVHCGDEQVACFRLAGEMCPRGYFLSPIFDPHDGNFLVRCKDSAQGVVAANASLQAATQPAPTVPAVTAASSPSRAAPPDPGWPPTEVARPAEPWPAPSAGAPAPQSAIGDVDLGY
jgi:hypothetical protein